MTLSSRSVVLAITLVAACAAALYGAFGDRGASAAESRAAAADAAAEFAVLRRAAHERDQPSAAANAMARGDREQARRSRRAALPLGSPDVRVLPREDDVCLLVETANAGGFAGYGCARWDDARAGRLHVTLSGGPDQGAGDALVVGLVPDHATSVRLRDRRGVDQLALSEGFYVARASVPESLVMSLRTGEQVIDLAGLPGRNE